MGPFFFFLTVYVVGGLTFIPLLLCLLLVHAHYTFPHVTIEQPQVVDVLKRSSDDGQNLRSGADSLSSKFYRDHEKESGGYFAVCREWIPGGINGKPPERTTPAGEVIVEESPSVYQSMYRSIFDRRQAPSMDIGKTNGKPTKKARNVFYIVLRHGHLMLYDDSEQVEVRHVVSLAHHDVTVYAGGEEIPEGELWIKRNAICLSRKPSGEKSMTPISKPFYLFSENCSEKEDFYFSLLQNQERDGTDERHPPLVQHYETKHIISLVQRLHSSEEHLQTRWINAMIGRLFLGVYKTKEIEDLVRAKITKKIARVKRPTFLSRIVLQRIDLGESAPFITNPRLKDLTVEGDCCMEADVKYEGNFRIEIATTARIDLGARFKAREVNLVLAITLKKLEGHLLVKFKSPPSNRVWMSFETMPHMEMHIEPIVSSRQITYGLILRAIESRIREVLAETLVLPHWDDSPFLSTLGQHFRGGIWVNERRDFQAPTLSVVPDEVSEDSAEAGIPQDVSGLTSATQDDKSMSMPSLVDTARPSIFARKAANVANSIPDETNTGISSSTQRTSEPPRSIRSKSFILPADPIVSADTANRDPARPDSKSSKDAASFMAEISNRSQPSSPVHTPMGSYDSAKSSMAERERLGHFTSSSPKFSDAELGHTQDTFNGNETLFARSPASLSARSTVSSVDSTSNQSTRLQSVARGLTPSEKKQQVLTAAALAARNWGWKTLTKTKGGVSPVGTPDRAGTPEQPMGRGRPLPPPGQPLPPPEKRSSAASFASAASSLVPKRKVVPPPMGGPPQIPERRHDNGSRQSFPIPPTHRSDRGSISQDTPPGEGIFVVEAPEESEPSSPVDDDGYGEFLDNVNSDDEEGFEPGKHAAGTFDGTEATKDGDKELPPFPRTSHGNESFHGAHGLASWQNAQEEEARAQSVWMDEQEHS